MTQKRNCLGRRKKSKGIIAKNFVCWMPAIILLDCKLILFQPLSEIQAEEFRNRQKQEKLEPEKVRGEGRRDSCSGENNFVRLKSIFHGAKISH